MPTTSTVKTEKKTTRPKGDQTKLVPEEEECSAQKAPRKNKSQSQVLSGLATKVHSTSPDPQEYGVYAGDTQGKSWWRCEAWWRVLRYSSGKLANLGLKGHRNLPIFGCCFFWLKKIGVAFEVLYYRTEPNFWRSADRFARTARQSSKGGGRITERTLTSYGIVKGVWDALVFNIRLLIFYYIAASAQNKISRARHAIKAAKAP